MTIIDITERRTMSRTVELLLNTARIADVEVADELGTVSRQVVQQRRTGVSQWKAEEYLGLAEMLGVPVELFAMEPDQAMLRAVEEYDFVGRMETRRAARRAESRRRKASRVSSWKRDTAGQKPRRARSAA